MGCNCNQPSNNWLSVEWVIAMAQKIADAKQIPQTVFKNDFGYSFTDADSYSGDKTKVIVHPK